MDSIEAFVVTNWPFIAAIVGILFGPKALVKLKDLLSKVKLPNFPLFKKAVVKDVGEGLHAKDQAAIDWLANRAVDVGDETLIVEMESVNTKFYNIHRSMRKSAVGPVEN